MVDKSKIVFGFLLFLVSCIVSRLDVTLKLFLLLIYDIFYFKLVNENYILDISNFFC